MNNLYKNNVRLNDINGVNRLLARCINAVIQDEITEDKGRTITYMANVLLKGLQVGDLETRLINLEDRIEKVS